MCLLYKFMHVTNRWYLIIKLSVQQTADLRRLSQFDSTNLFKVARCRIDWELHYVSDVVRRKEATMNWSIGFMLSPDLKLTIGTICIYFHDSERPRVTLDPSSGCFDEEHMVGEVLDSAVDHHDNMGHNMWTPTWNNDVNLLNFVIWRFCNQ